MENIIDYGGLDVDRGALSLDKFIESDAPGTLSWLNREDNECSSVVPSFDSIKLHNPFIPCRRLCAGCRRWQIESPGQMDFSDDINPQNKLKEEE